MKKWFLYAAVFFVSYIIFMVATLPVNRALSYVSLPKNIQLVAVTGSMWDIKVKQVIIRATNNKRILINNINIRLSVSSLLLFDPSVAVSFGGHSLSGPKGQLTANHLLNDISISDAKIALDAAEVIAQLSLPIAVEAFGKMSLNLQDYTLGKPLCKSAKGTITWPKAALAAFEQTAELGTLKAKLSCEKGVLVASVEPKNNLGLTFTTYIRSSKHISGNGYLKPTGKFPPALTQVLPFLGKPDRNGRYRLNF
ncbi:MAG: type II secretion system protein N [Alteromonadaceae bacterium]|nr:type II secretion system protein N [Alteromonadaceae bacterium]